MTRWWMFVAQLARVILEVAERRIAIEDQPIAEQIKKAWKVQ